jgi:hypothetical protein
MPDMKTALTNAMLKQTIDAWANDDQPIKQSTNQKEKAMANLNPVVNITKNENNQVRFAASVGVARAVFDHVKANTGAPRAQLIDELLAKGFKDTSVRSLITQNIRSGIFQLDGHGRVHCHLSEYKPVGPSSAKRKAKALQAALKKKAPKTTKPLKLVTKKPKTITLVNGIAALKVDTVEKALPLPLPVNKFEPGALIDSLSVMQARELYDMLKRIFGG